MCEFARRSGDATSPRLAWLAWLERFFTRARQLRRTAASKLKPRATSVKQLKSSRVARRQSDADTGARICQLDGPFEFSWPAAASVAKRAEWLQQHDVDSVQLSRRVMELAAERAASAAEEVRKVKRWHNRNCFFAHDLRLHTLPWPTRTCGHSHVLASDTAHSWSRQLSLHADRGPQRCHEQHGACLAANPGQQAPRASHLTRGLYGHEIPHVLPAAGSGVQLRCGCHRPMHAAPC